MTLRLTEINTKKFIGTVLECEGNGDGKYGNRIEKWVVHDVLELDGYNIGGGPDILNEEHSLEIKSQRSNTTSNITLVALSQGDYVSYNNWSNAKKKKVNCDFIFVDYDAYDDIIEITDITVIRRSEFAAIFELKIQRALDNPNKVIDGVIFEYGKYPKLRITQNRLRKDILRKSCKYQYSTIDSTLFEIIEDKKKPRLGKDIFRKSSEEQHSTIDTLFEI